MWSSYSTPTRFLVSQTSATISVKPVFGGTVVDQGDAAKIDAQVLSSDGSAANSAAVTLNVYNPSGTKIVTSQSMSYISGSNGIYRYAYTIPSTNGSYLYDVTAVSSGITGFGAANFEVRTIAADITSTKSTVTSNSSTLSTINTNVNTVNTNVSNVNSSVGTLITEIGTGNIAAIKTKTDTINWANVTGIVTTTGEIKTKTDNINWDDVTALKTKTDTINWSDITGIKSKTDTVNWNDVTSIKNATVSVTGSVSDSSPSDSSFVTDLSSSKDDFYKNMVLTFTSGDNSGQSRRISGYSGSNKTVTVDPAFSYTPSNGDHFLISVGSVRAEELSGSVKSSIESIQSKLNTLTGTLPSDYSGMYDQLKALAASLSKLGVIQGSGADSLYSISAESKDDVKYLKNKLLDLQAALEINKAMLLGGQQNSIFSSWYTYHSVVLNMLIANPTDRKANIPFKAYLPKEAKPENVISSDGLKIEFDEGAHAYFVGGQFTLGAKESIAKKVELKDIWQMDETELNAYKTQASDLYNEAQKTSYSAQALVLKNDVSNKVDSILRKQKDNNSTPTEHIQTFRDNQDDLASIKENLKKLTDLVTSAGAGRGLIASVGGIQSIATWGIVVILIAGLGILGAFSYSMWKHQMMVMASLSEGKLNDGQKEIPVEPIDAKSEVKEPTEDDKEHNKDTLLRFDPPRVEKHRSFLFSKLSFFIIFVLVGGILIFLIKINVLNLKPGSSVKPVASVAPTPSYVAKPTRTPAAQKKVIITETGTGWLNVRSQASTKGKILEKVDVGDTFEEVDRTDIDAEEKWVKIKLHSGVSGWVLGKYTLASTTN